MAKQSGFLAKIKAQHENEKRIMRLFTMQWCADAALIAANEVFQRRGKKLVEFHKAFVKWAHAIAEMTLDDAEDDKTIEYTKAKVDARLQDLLGEDFQPWESRYNIH